MSGVTTIPAKYIFLDVVGFTHNRSVEAQTDIVNSLNKIVESSVNSLEIPKEQLIYMPTGDGICIALLNVETPYDVHIQIALKIIESIVGNNENIDNEMRRFEVRIGINSNIDNLVTDINGNQNIAGAGINMASRVLSMADGNQILVGEAVYDTLRYRERYMSAFSAFQAEVKHGLVIPVYQLIGNGYTGLNTNIPQSFQTPERVDPKLTKLAAYYFGHAIKNRDFFIKLRDQTKKYAGTVLLFFLAKDSVSKSEASEIEIPFFDTYKAGTASISEQLDYYFSMDNSVLSEFADSIYSTHLSQYRDCFEKVLDPFEYRFINSKGMEKLKTEWPTIWEELELKRCA